MQLLLRTQILIVMIIVFIIFVGVEYKMESYSTIKVKTAENCLYKQGNDPENIKKKKNGGVCKAFINNKCYKGKWKPFNHPGDKIMPRYLYCGEIPYFSTTRKICRPLIFLSLGIIIVIVAYIIKDYYVK